MFNSHYLRSELVLFWRQSLNYRFVKGIKTVTVGVVENTDPVHLCVVWAHDGAVIADKRLSCFAVVLERLTVNLAAVLNAHRRKLSVPFKCTVRRLAKETGALNCCAHLQ